MTKIGVIGVGGMGKAHCRVLKQVERGEFAGVWDLSPEAARAAAEEFEVRAFESLEALLDAVDGVVVATPGFVHTEPVITAAGAGVHVFVEKPLAATLEDCDAMIEAIDENKVLSQVGMVLRFYPTHQLGMKLIRNGVIGDVTYIETDYSGKHNAPRQRPDTWYGKMGGFLENGIHKADLINWLGGTPQTVAAEVGSLSGNDDWEDYATTLIRFDTGIHGILRWGGFMGARGTTDTYVDGSKGSLRLCIRTQTVFKKMLGDEDWTELVPDNHGTNPVLDEDQHFIDCIAEGRTPLVDARAGRLAVALVLAAYQSAREGSKVKLPL